MRRGFDAIVGNPPWVSYAGKAAQPIEPARRRYYMAFFEAFGGYRNLQGMFVERAAGLVRPEGRMGLILPSSMAELDGYGPSRCAHDRLAECDPDLPDLGEDGFRGVFQPSMVLRSTVRKVPLSEGRHDAWPIEKPDLDDEARALLRRLSGPVLPPELFGERGLQTTATDTAHFRPTPDETHTVPLRVGSDIKAFLRAAPSLYADPAHFGPKLRSSVEWARVAVLVRQTARVPTAVLSDGVGFRNSLLAGFATADYPATFLVAYLNATAIRWRHYFENRDARFGMPQVKIGHLRAIPAPPARTIRALAQIGREISERNAGITIEETRVIDDVVGEGFSLSSTDRARIERDAEAWQ